MTVIGERSSSLSPWAFHLILFPCPAEEEKRQSGWVGTSGLGDSQPRSTHCSIEQRKSSFLSISVFSAKPVQLKIKPISYTNWRATFKKQWLRKRYWDNQLNDNWLKSLSGKCNFWECYGKFLMWKQSIRIGRCKCRYCDFLLPFSAWHLWNDFLIMMSASGVYSREK